MIGDYIMDWCEVNVVYRDRYNLKAGIEEMHFFSLVAFNSKMIAKEFTVQGQKNLCISMVDF